MIQKRPHDGGTSFHIWSGEQIPRTFTPETDQEQIDVFYHLLIDNKETIFAYTKEYHAAIERNSELRKAGKQGKNWPIFNTMEKLLNKLQKQAGIVNS